MPRKKKLEKIKPAKRDEKDDKQYLRNAASLLVIIAEENAKKAKGR